MIIILDKRMSSFWYQSGNIPDAIALSRKQSKLFVVYISGSDDISKKMDELWEDNRVVSLCERSCVALKLGADSDGCKQFSAIYPVFCIPSAYFIDNTGKLVEAMSFSPLSDFVSKIENVTKPYLHDEASVSAPAETASTSGEVSVNQDKATEKPMSKEEQPRSSKSSSPVKDTGNADVEKSEAKKAREKSSEKTPEIDASKKKLKETQVKKGDEVASQLKKYRSSNAGKFEKKSDEEKRKVDLKQSQILESQQKEAEEKRAIKMSQSRLQFRMPDGSAIVETFPAEDCLSSAVTFIKDQNAPSLEGLSFELSQLYPRRTFTEDHYNKSYRELDLVPTASLVVLPVKESPGSVSNQTLNKLLSLLIFILMLPFRFLSELWKFISRPAVQPSSSSGYEPTHDSSSRSTDHRQATGNRNVRQRRLGNMARLSDTVDDDDNATWNGNSTQQM